MTEGSNRFSHEVEIGKANVLKTGSLATVIAFGPTLDYVMPAIKDLDVGLLYYTTIAPFDGMVLSENIAPSGKILLIEPFYTGTMTHEVSNALDSKFLKIKSIGVPRSFLRNYGNASEHNKKIGLDADNIKRTLQNFIDE